MQNMDETLATTPQVHQIDFEACAEYRSRHHEAECVACGWLEIDHHAAVFAEVIPVPQWAEMPLRRAS